MRSRVLSAHRVSRNVLRSPWMVAIAARLVFTALPSSAQTPLNNSQTIPVPPIGQPASGSPDFESSNGIYAEHCMVQYINKTRLPAESQGKLVELKIEEGNMVSKDEVLAIIDDKQARLAYELKLAELKEAELNAANDINLRDARSSEKIAIAEAKSYQELGEKGAATRYDVLKKQLEADRAQLRIELAELQMKTAQAVYMAKRQELQIAQMDIDMREIKADFDAFVETRIAQLGEWVQPGSPIAELVQMDELRVEGDIPALENAGMVSIGSPVKIRVTVGIDANNEPKYHYIDSVIQYVSTEIDLNKQYRVWAKIANPRVGRDWMIKPGMAAVMIVNPSAPLR